MNTKEFNTKLAAFKKSTTKQRDNLQALIVAGIEQVNEHGNTVYLSKTLSVCVGVRAFPTNTIKDYIKAHVSNIVWTKDKAGNMVFKKEVKANAFEVVMPTVPWYDHALNNKNNATDDMDVDKMANLFIARLNKGLKEGKVKDAAKAQAILKALVSVESEPVQSNDPQQFDSVDAA